jgi:exopolysaccharide production protein ExoZ
MLSNLQVLRGVAALGVVFFHTDYRLAGDWHTEFFGVSTFFVISGFIMCLVTRNNADDFLQKRLVRIVPLYWLSTLAVLVVMFGFAIFDMSTWTSGLADRPGESLWSYVGRSLFFFPFEDKYPILNVGWSLNFEMYFYLIFAAALWIDRRAAPFIVVGTLVVLSFAGGAVCTAPVCHYLSFDYIQFFIAGIVLFQLHRHLDAAAPQRPVAWIGAILLAVCYGSQFVGPWWSSAMSPGLYVAVATAAPMVIVASALIMERAGGAVTWRPLILIGNASYAIYLTHTIVGAIITAGNDRWLQFPSPRESAAVMLVHVVVACAAAILVHLYIENPMLRILRGKDVRGAAQSLRSAGLVEASRQ